MPPSELTTASRAGAPKAGQFVEAVRRTWQPLLVLLLAAAVGGIGKAATSATMSVFHRLSHNSFVNYATSERFTDIQRAQGFELAVTYCAIFTIYCFVSLGTVAFSVWMIERNTNRGVDRSPLLLLAAALILGISGYIFKDQLAALLLHGTGDTDRDYTKFDGVFDLTIFAPTAGFIRARLLLDMTLNAANLLAVLASVAIATAAASILFNLGELRRDKVAATVEAKAGQEGEPTDSDSEQQKSRLLQRFSRRIKRLRATSTVASILLAAGVANTAAWMSWPTPFLADNGPAGEERVRVFGTMVRTALTVEAVGYFVILLVIFVVPAGILYWSAHKALRHGWPDSRFILGRPVKEGGLFPSTSHLLADSLKIVAPLLAAPLADLVKLAVS
jgi:hypothetical protein